MGGTDVPVEQLVSAAEKIFDFEMNLALRMSPASDRRNSTAMYNPMTIAELKALMPNMDWDKYLAAAFVDTDVNVGDHRRFWRQGPVLHRPVQQLHRARADPHPRGGGRPPQRGEHAGGEHRGQRGNPRVVQGLRALRGEPGSGASSSRTDSVHTRANVLHLQCSGLV